MAKDMFSGVTCKVQLQWCCIEYQCCVGGQPVVSVLQWYCVGGQPVVSAYRYDFSGDCEVVVTTLHWHAHAVGDLCFTTDGTVMCASTHYMLLFPVSTGTYLLSGGVESVLVLWQLKTSHKQFRPRLGSPITRVSCSEDDTCFAVSLQNNGIHNLMQSSHRMLCGCGYMPCGCG